MLWYLMLMELLAWTVLRVADMVNPIMGKPPVSFVYGFSVLVYF